MSTYVRVHVACALGVGSVLAASAIRTLLPGHPDLRWVAGIALAAASLVCLERLAGPRPAGGQR